MNCLKCDLLGEAEHVTFNVGGLEGHDHIYSTVICFRRRALYIDKGKYLKFKSKISEFLFTFFTKECFMAKYIIS